MILTNYEARVAVAVARLAGAAAGARGAGWNCFVFQK